ncbi:MAG TPA: phosphatidylserine decarboxylase [Candidatus Methanoperedenaceae archaeon]|nr:phosphatidylserine decarboxylase [Candidatus Methanoperedenaceae archaeon]
MLAKGSAQWILGALAGALLSGGASHFFEGIASQVLYAASVAGFGLTVFFLVFFRDPERMPAGSESDVISPADGKVISVKDRTVCIFMNFDNVHVNRAPLSGTVKRIEYTGGSYIPAFNKDSLRNERNRITFATAFGDIVVTQIAGIVTRRITSYISEGNRVERGQRIGMIRFGSRVDTMLPPDFECTVSAGSMVKAGETIIAKRVLH